MPRKKIINGYPHVEHLHDFKSAEEVSKSAKDFYDWYETRRTIREISSKEVAKSVIEDLILTASTAPSGAHKQPWTFCAISDSNLKKEIRIAAEKEEYETYHNRMSDRWKKDLEPIGTDWHKPFLEEAPWLIIVFKKVYEHLEGEKHNNYYVNESVGIACGFLISAIHKAGLVTLTHTPSPMNFLKNILKRPENERPFLLLPVGHPKKEVYVPDLERKPLSEVSVFY